MPKKDKCVVDKAYLWIYSAKTGQCKFHEVSIHQQIHPYNSKPLDVWYAVSDAGLNRLVSGYENSVWYYARNREYSIWSKTNDADKARKLLIRSVQLKASEKIKKCLETLCQENEYLQIANANLLNNSNSIMSTTAYKDVNSIPTITNYNGIKSIIDTYLNL